MTPSTRSKTCRKSGRVACSASRAAAGCRAIEPQGVMRTEGSQFVDRTLDSQGAAVEYRGGDHRRPDIAVARQEPDASNVGSVLARMVCEAVRRVCGMTREIEVLDAQPQAFQQPETRAADLRSVGPAGTASSATKSASGMVWLRHSKRWT